MQFWLLTPRQMEIKKRKKYSSVNATTKSFEASYQQAEYNTRESHPAIIFDLVERLLRKT